MQTLSGLKLIACLACQPGCCDVSQPGGQSGLVRAWGQR